MKCSITSVDRCGEWGEGRLITLYELDPEKYPQGTPTIIESIVGGPVELIATSTAPSEV